MIPRLFAITPGRPGHPLSLVWLLEAMAEAGLKAVVLREPAMDERDYVALARAVAPLFGPGLVLHGKNPCALDIARASGWGLHCPAGMDLRQARAAVRGLLGASCHSLDELEAAREAGCDYATLSPVFSPSSKPDDRPPLGLSTLRRAASHAGLPVLALGGVTPERAAACVAAGAAGVAVLGGLFPPDALPETAAESVAAYLAALR